MSATVEVQRSEASPVKQSDEAVWKAWVAKGRAREQRNSARRVRVVKMVSIAVLLATAAFGSHLAGFEVPIRFVVAIGSVVGFLQAFHARQYAVAAIFAVLTLLYNPLIPMLSFVGDWQWLAVAATSIPFVASLGWRGAHAN